jgi:hypothetical protein
MPRRNLFYFFFAPYFEADTMHRRPPQSLSPCTPSPQLYTIAEVDCWLVVASPHQAEAIKTQGPVALSILIFSVARFVAQNDK